MSLHENEPKSKSRLVIERALEDMDIPKQDRYNVFVPKPYSNKLVQYMAEYCIAMIQLKMPRNGVNSPENLQSKKHIKDIAEAFNIDLANINPYWYELNVEESHSEPTVDYRNTSLQEREHIEKLERHMRVYNIGKTYKKYGSNDD